LKKIITGAVILLTGAILFLSVFIVGGNLAPTLTEWYTNSGKLWTAISEAKLYPVFAISIVAMIAGIVILIREYFDKSD